MNWKLLGGIGLGILVAVIAAYLLKSSPDDSLMTLRAHDGPVRSIAVSPDGTRFASVGDDGRVYLWATENFMQLRDWSAHGGRIRSAAFGANNILATASDDHTVKVWDNAGQQLHSFDVGTKAAECVAMSAKYIAAGGADNLVRIWNHEGKLLHTLKGHKKHVHAVAISPDEKLLVSGGSGGTVRLWNPATGQSLGELVVKGGHFAALDFSVDGKTLMGGGHGLGVKLWDVSTKKEKSLEGEDPGTLNAAMTVTGSRIASVHEDALVRVWDAAAGKQLQTLRGHRGGVTAVAWFTDGTRIITGGADGRVKIWTGE